MRVTRSSTAGSASSIVRTNGSSTISSSLKRQADDAADDPVTSPSTTPKRPRKAARAVPATPLPAPAIQSATTASSTDGTAVVDESEQISVRPSLSFDIDAAKKHLVSVDPRFANLFATLKCKPFEEESDLNPFRALCSSILGQQVSSVRQQRTISQTTDSPTSRSLGWQRDQSHTDLYVW